MGDEEIEGMRDWHADETGPPKRSADDYGFFSSLKLIFEFVLVLEKFYTELHGVFLKWIVLRELHRGVSLGLARG